MERHFALTVHLHDRRYHGADEWPPAPARVFQALVAGAAQGRHVPDAAARALKLLECFAPPVIAAPAARRGQRVSVFVPNNDLDGVDGDTEPVRCAPRRRCSRSSWRATRHFSMHGRFPRRAVTSCSRLLMGYFSSVEVSTQQGPSAKFSTASSSRRVSVPIAAPSTTPPPATVRMSWRFRRRVAL